MNNLITNNTELNTIISSLVSTIEKSDINLLNTLNTEFKALDFSKYTYDTFITYCSNTLDNRSYISKDKKSNYITMFKLLSLNKFYKLNLNKVMFYILMQDKLMINKLHKIVTNDIDFKVKNIFTGSHYDMFKDDVTNKNFVNSSLLPYIIKGVNKELNKLVKTIPLNKVAIESTIESLQVDASESVEEVTKDTDYMKLVIRDITKLHNEGVSKESLLDLIDSIYQ